MGPWELGVAGGKGERRAVGLLLSAREYLEAPVFPGPPELLEPKGS